MADAATDDMGNEKATGNKYPFLREIVVKRFAGGASAAEFK